MCRGERSFKPCQNEHDLEKEVKGKNSASKVVMKIPMKRFSPDRNKELEKAKQEKRQKMGGEKVKGKERKF